MIKIINLKEYTGLKSEYIDLKAINFIAPLINKIEGNKKQKIEYTAEVLLNGFYLKIVFISEEKLNKFLKELEKVKGC